MPPNIENNMNNIKHWDKPMPSEMKEKLDKTASDLKTDYLRGYNKAIKIAVEWLKDNVDCYKDVLFKSGHDFASMIKDFEEDLKI